VDNAGNVVTSTNPRGGAGAWAVGSVPDVYGNRSHFGGVGCAGASLCLAADYSFSELPSSSNPSGGASTWRAWSEPFTSSLFMSPQAISCPSSTFCVAGGNLGGGGLTDAVMTSTDPTGPASA